MSALSKLDLSLKLSKQEEAEQLAAAQERLLTLRLQLGGQTADELGPPLCVLFEGWDASGKGGAIKRLVDHLDPRHVRVVQYAAPTPDEKRHQYLLRFGSALPGWGGMAVLDRSWYGRVLVERVEGFAEKARVEARLPRDQRLRARAVRRRDDPRQALAARLRGGAAQALRGARAGPAEVLEADRRGLAQPRPARRVRGRGRGDGPEDVDRVGAVVAGPGEFQALRPRRRAQHGDRRDRGEACVA